MYEYNAVVKNILDANTVELLVDLGFGVTIRRVFGIVGATAPTFKNNDDPQAAQAAKTNTITHLSNRQVLIRTQKIARYGRYVAEIFVDGRQYPW